MDEQQVLTKATRIGRMIKIWSWIEKLSFRITTHSTKRINDLTAEKDELLDSLERKKKKPVKS